MEMAEVSQCQIEEWRRDLSYFEEQKTDLEDELDGLCSNAYLLASCYAAFQGVIFAYVSHANGLPCQLWWIPVFLSIAVSVAIFVSIFRKLYRIGVVREDRKGTDHNMLVIMECLDNSEGRGIGELERSPQHYERNACAGYRYIRSRDGILVLLFLTGVSVVIASFFAQTLFRHCPPCPS